MLSYYIADPILAISDQAMIDVKNKRMKISFEDNGDNVIFRVSDFDPAYEDILKMCFYHNDGKGYTKTYPKNAKYMDRIKAHYLKNAREMFSQLGYFRPIPWERALIEFLKRVDGTEIDWWLAGSCAACIRGIPLKPHDVDIMISSKCVERVTDLFADVIIEPIVDTHGWLTKDFGVLFCHARIDIASDPQACLDDPEPVDCGPYARAHLETVSWNGFEVRVPPLRLQLNANKRRGRFDRCDLIREYMDKTASMAD